MQHLGRERKDKLFNFRPIFFTATFLCLGVVFAYLRIFYSVSLWWLLLLVGIFVPLLFCEKEKLGKTAVCLLILLFAFAVGGLCYFAQVRNYANANIYNGEYTVRGIVEEKTMGRKSSCLILSNISVGKKEENFKLVAYLPTSFCENVRLYDEISLRGTVQTQGAELYAEEYCTYLFQEGIKYKMLNAESCVVHAQNFHVFGRIRERVSAVLYAGMDTDPTSITLAVLTGNTAGIEGGLLQNMRYGGIAHVFAVSGLHVGALYAFCMLLTKKTALRKTPKPVRFLLVTATLLFYGGVCGFSASVVRATILCLISYLAKLIGTAFDKFEVIGLSAIFILLLSPAELFGVGFQLSFLACLGIFLWAKPLEKWGNHVCDEGKKRLFLLMARKDSVGIENKEKADGLFLSIAEKIREKSIAFLSVSTSAQIATAPVLLQAFGYISGWSLLLNCIFVPLIGAIFSVLLSLVALSCVLPLSFSAVLLYLPNAVWSAVLLLFEEFDFSLFAIRGVTLSAGALACYYLALTFFSDKWNLRSRERFALGTLCAIGWIATLVIRWLF